MADVIDHPHLFCVFHLSVELNAFLEICAAILDDAPWHPCFAEDLNQGILDEWTVPPGRDLQTNAFAVL